MNGKQAVEQAKVRRAYRNGKLTWLRRWIDEKHVKQISIEIFDEKTLQRGSIKINSDIAAETKYRYRILLCDNNGELLYDVGFPGRKLEQYKAPGGWWATQRDAFFIRAQSVHEALTRMPAHDREAVAYCVIFDGDSLVVYKSPSVGIKGVRDAVLSRMENELTTSVAEFVVSLE